MSKIFSLKATLREKVGGGASRAARREKMIPAVVYGHGKEHLHIEVPLKETTLEYHKNGFYSHLFDLDVNGKKYRVIPKKIQLHPVTDNIIHVDFMHISATDKVKLSVPLDFINKDKCPGIKQGGVLTIPMHDLEIMCLADNMPENIVIDLEGVAVGQTIHISDLKLPKGVTATHDAGTTIAAIQHTRASNTAEEATE